jgi:type VI secretion system protein ImpC
MNPSDTGLDAKFALENNPTGIVEEPPFRILILGDWSADSEKAALEERRPFEIDRDNFDEAISRLGSRLDLEMDGGAVISLSFADLDDFHPDQIFRRVPLFAELRDLRTKLMDEGTFNAAARDVRERLGVNAELETSGDAVPTGVASSDDPPANDLLDAILAKPSGGAAAPKLGVSSEIADLVSDLVRPHLVSVDEDEQSKMIAAVDVATSDLMRGILHHPRFQELEAAWRGLYFLVRRTETSNDLKLYLFDMSKAELTDNLKSNSSLAETVFYRHLVRDSIETPGGEPFAAVLGNYAFDPGVDDIATLIRIGKMAAAANAPFISYMSAEVFGVSSLANGPDPSSWKLDADNNASKLWMALRDQSEAVYLGMAIPRFLARVPYGIETDPLETFAFEEFDRVPDHDKYVWSNPCFAVGQLLAASYADHRWEMGRLLKQDIEGLPVHVYKEGTETVYKPCTEVLLPDIAFEKLMGFGFMPLVTFKNSDRVKLARHQSIADTALKGMWN